MVISLFPANFPKAIGEDFEYAVESFFRQRDIPIFDTPTTHDFGVDLILYLQGKCIAIQCKDHRSPVGVDAVQAVASGAAYYGTDLGVVVCTGRFTSSARKLAKATGVILIDGPAFKKVFNDDDVEASYFQQLLGISLVSEKQSQTARRKFWDIFLPHKA